MARASQNVMDEARKQLVQATQYKEELRKQYAAEDKVPMYLSPMYRPYFGKIMRVAVNGVCIYMPVDGSTQQVPRTFADEIERRRKSIDSMLTKQNRMSDITANHENAPGELSLF